MATRITIILLLFGITNSQAYSQSAEKKVLKLMGSRFEITVVANNDTIAWQAINAGIHEIQRIEKLISSWDPDSQTSLINKNAGLQAVKVDKELFDLIYRSKKVSQLTKGAFDISFASMNKLWLFDGSAQPMPPKETIKVASSKVNWENILMNKEETSVFLADKGMEIGFGAIGKGYAANKAKQLMQNIEKVRGVLINAGGDLIAWGQAVTSSGWEVKIADPAERDKALGALQIENMAVVTSGDYEKYAIINGKRYAHIIDPRTGYPTTGIKSTTIVCPDAELADALATSVIVLGEKEGMKLINSLNGIECLIVTNENEVLTSKNLKLNYY